MVKLDLSSRAIQGMQHRYYVLMFEEAIMKVRTFKDDFLGQ